MPPPKQNHDLKPRMHCQPAYLLMFSCLYGLVFSSATGQECIFTDQPALKELEHTRDPPLLQQTHCWLVNVTNKRAHGVGKSCNAKKITAANPNCTITIAPSDQPLPYILWSVALHNGYMYVAAS